MSNFNPLQIALRPLFKQAKEEDALFAIEVAQKEARTENPKSFEECCDYIMGEAYKYAKDHKNGNCGLAFADEEQMIDMIKHYYDEDGIKIEPMVGASAKVKTTGKDKDNEEEVAVKTPVAPKPKGPSKAELAKGADCYDLFS